LWWLTENFEKTELFEPVKKQDFRALSSQDEPLLGLNAKQLHRVGVLAAIRGFHEQKRVKKAIL
jgi:hypothetical protein